MTELENAYTLQDNSSQKYSNDKNNIYSFTKILTSVLEILYEIKI